MKSHVIYGDETAEHTKAACAFIDEVVGSTLGPGGATAIADSQWAMPHVTKDGVSVAKYLWDCLSPEHKLPGRVLINAALKQLQDAGDGTTTTIVIANKLVQEGYKRIEVGATRRRVIADIKSDVERVLSGLELLKQPVDTIEDLTKVATIASNGDVDVGAIVAEAVHKTGEDGRVTHERSAVKEHSLEHSDGYSWPRGPESMYFNTDTHKMNAVHADPFILVTDHVIEWNESLGPLINEVLLEEAKKTKRTRSLVIIAPIVKGEALVTLVRAHMDSGHFLAVRPDGLASEAVNTLRDIAAVTGATVISAARGQDLRDVKLSDLGTCERIESDSKGTLIVRGAGNIEGPVKALKNILDNSNTTDPVRDETAKRLARLTKGVAVIKVGGKTEIEQAEIMDRVDDAIRATKCAQTGGIVDGAGMALVSVIKRLSLLSSAVVRDAVYAPKERMWRNSEYVEDICVPSGKNANAINLDTGEPITGTMLEAGIIDPFIVVKSALENAVSVAVTLLSAKNFMILDQQSLGERNGNG